MLLISCTFTGKLLAQGFEGIDDTVFTRVAEDLNMKGWELFPWIEGESIEKLKVAKVYKEINHG